MTASLCASDEVLTPMQCEFLSLEGLSKILFVIDQIRDSGIQPGIIHEGILMTMYNNTNLANQVIDQVQENLPDKIYETVIPRSVRVAEAPSFGRTVLEHDPEGAAAWAYKNAAKEFLRRHRLCCAGFTRACASCATSRASRSSVRIASLNFPPCRCPFVCTVDLP